MKARIYKTREELESNEEEFFYITPELANELDYPVENLDHPFNATEDVELINQLLGYNPIPGAHLYV